ncbi:MAG: CHAP domain-containing protein [Chthoniobacterales bacterium]|nr:CHAP domain-containing protein [Chthoniobacterales bacterium]
MDYVFRHWGLLFLLASFPALPAGAANPLLKGNLLQRITVTSATDGIPSGWCGRAMLSLLNKSGLGKGLKPGNGQDWEQILATAGWRPVKVSSPTRAPLGSILVYTGDRRKGKMPRGTPGGYFGHVEMVSLAPGGGRIYVADSPRPVPGGSVPDNFTGRAWVPPGTMLGAPQPIDLQVDAIMAQRLQMALAFFDTQKIEQASLQGRLRVTEE